MKLNRKILRQLIKEEMERLSYASKDQGFTFGIEHLSDYFDDQDANDIIGHTWQTHVKRKVSSLDERKKKKKTKKRKKKPSNRWYFGAGRHYHHDDDWDDFGGFDGDFGGGSGDGGGGGE